MLGPAAPIGSSRLASVRASLRLQPGSPICTTWEWDDGQVERAQLEWQALVHAHRAHRYVAPGVYRVQLRVDVSRPRHRESAARYVVVVGSDQWAASGWIRVPDGAPVPFGFLVTPTAAGRAGQVLLRCQLEGAELVSGDLAWLLAGDASTLHFGGNASIAGQAIHPFRLDATAAGRERAGQQHVALSIYAPGGVPGRDAPVRRLSGPVRPGRIVLRGMVALP